LDGWSLLILFEAVAFDIVLLASIYIPIHREYIFKRVGGSELKP